MQKKLLLICLLGLSARVDAKIVSVVVDGQNGFAPDSTRDKDAAPELGVDDLTPKVVSNINAVNKAANFIQWSADEHSPNHCGSNKSPFWAFCLNARKMTRSWPEHCVEGTKGSQLLLGLERYPEREKAYVKGKNIWNEEFGAITAKQTRTSYRSGETSGLTILDIYSPFSKRKTLGQDLVENSQFEPTKWVFTGVAGNICVDATIKQAVELRKKHGLENVSMYVLSDAIAVYVDPKKDETLDQIRQRLYKEWRDLGVNVVTTKEMLHA